MAYAGDHVELLEAFGQGRFSGTNLEDLITRKIGLEDLVEKGIKGLIYEKHEMGTCTLLVYRIVDRLLLLSQ